MNIELFTLGYNEAEMIPFMVQHYRERFPNILINYYDNDSTDNSVELAANLDCNVVSYPNFNNEMSNSFLNTFRNNIWKQSKADWVIVIDTDEFIEMNYKSLSYCDQRNETHIQSVGYHMIGDTSDFSLLTEGVRDIMYDKTCIFKPKKISQINYSIGGHSCSPKGTALSLSQYRPTLYHIRYPSVEYVWKRYSLYASRRGEEDKQNGWGHQYEQTREQIQDEFNKLMQKKTKIRDGKY